MVLIYVAGSAALTGHRALATRANTCIMPAVLDDDDPWAAAARVELAGRADRDAWVALLWLTAKGAKPTLVRAGRAAAGRARRGQLVHACDGRRELRRAQEPRLGVRYDR